LGKPKREEYATYQLLVLLLLIIYETKPQVTIETQESMFGAGKRLLSKNKGNENV
jgi:hypothetical protein